MKHLAALLLLVTLSAVVAAGCSATTTNTIQCSYHGWRAVHDTRSHAYGWAAFQAAATAHHCKTLIP